MDTSSSQPFKIGEMKSIGGDRKAAAHVLAIPLQGRGHITPMLKITTQLACEGITVSFVCFEDTVPRLPLSADHGSSEPKSLDFRFLTLSTPRLEPPDLNNSSMSVYASTLVETAFQPLMEKLIRDKSAGIASPTCIISDMFTPWTLDVAEKLQIPRYMLVTSGVTFARLMQGCIECFERGQFQISEKDGKLVEFDGSICVSGLPALSHYELSNVSRLDPAFFLAACGAMMKSAGVVVNSFFELEEKVVEVFNNPGLPGNEHIKVPKLYPVGPLFSTTVLTETTGMYGLDDSSTKCLLWLGSQPSSSVLYVAFGSIFRLRPDQIYELALGLKASEQRFLWVIPQSRDGSGDEGLSINNILPPGFQETVGSRCCIMTGWAPQLQILAHTAIGGFFTHSGWNSSLESVIFGVPMICYPQGAEQHLNSRYLTEELKIAENLQTGRENVLNRSEVERAVRLLMVEPEGAEMRKRVQELKGKAAAAMAEGGSRARYFQEFLHAIGNREVSADL